MSVESVGCKGAGRKRSNRKGLNKDGCQMRIKRGERIWW